MKLSLRFIVPLPALQMYTLAPAADRAILQWFVRDLDLRARTIANAIQKPLRPLIDNGRMQGKRALMRGEGLLLLHEVGFGNGNDSLFVGTVEAIERDLLYGDYVFRYFDEDDSGAPSNAFLVSTFW